MLLGGEQHIGGVGNCGQAGPAAYGAGDRQGQQRGKLAQFSAGVADGGGNCVVVLD